LLAGRKLLLADDSVTIQKVIDLTFADEGVRVVAFSNGEDAIAHLEEVAPDIVLADVFMPSKNGYEVCEYVKTHEKLRHIPVVLLVGSFEPFDEAEARRVGADEILTKPFQSIRRLIDRVGALVSSPPMEKEVPTAELPQSEAKLEQEEIGLNTEELEVTTANTQPLPDELRNEAASIKDPVMATASVSGEEHMELGATEGTTDSQFESSDALLDLGDFEPASASDSDDFVLDLDLDEPFVRTNVPAAYEAASVRAFVEPPVIATDAGVGSAFSYQPQVQHDAFANTQDIPYEDQVHEVEAEQSYRAASGPLVTEPEAGVADRVAPSSMIAIDKLSPEMIDAIARRAVEMLSEKVIREIAWEVVPDLAELLIKRQLQEKESQPK
jgi:CheY-like chemotaxis protein